MPMSMGHIRNLEAFNLSYNNLWSSIPTSLESFPHINYFNVSFNALTGEIPMGGAFQNFTMDSFLANKDLCGIERFHVPPCRRKKRVSSRLLYILLGVTAYIVVVSTILIFIIIYSGKKDKETTKADDFPLLALERIFYCEILQEPEQFSKSKLLRIGSFRSIYKGFFQDGKVWAIKVFNLELEFAFEKFEMECEVLHIIRRRNLTQVIGSCSNNDFEALVLKYIPNGRLEKWLYSETCCLDVVQRLNIMINVGFALEYLHHSCSTPIIHYI